MTEDDSVPLLEIINILLRIRTYWKRLIYFDKANVSEVPTRLTLTLRIISKNSSCGHR